MIEQSTQTPASTNGILGTLGSTGKGSKASSGGLFGALMAAFEKHLQHSEATGLVAGKKSKVISAKQHGLLAQKAMMGLQVAAKGDAKDSAKGEAQITKKTIQGLESLKKHTSKDLLAVNKQKLVLDTGQADTNADVLVKNNTLLQTQDDTTQDAEHVLVGLAVAMNTQQIPTKVSELLTSKSLEKGGDKEEGILSEDKTKNILASLVKEQVKSQGLESQQTVHVDKPVQAKDGKLLVSVGKQDDKSAQQTKGIVSLQGLDSGVDSSVDVSKLLVEDARNVTDKPLLIRSDKAKKSIQSTVKNQGDGITANFNVDTKTNQKLDIAANESQYDSERLAQSKHENLSTQNIAKIQSAFQPVTGSSIHHKAQVVSSQINHEVQASLQPSSALTEHAVQAVNNSPSNSSDSDSPTHSAAEMLAATDLTSRDARMGRNDFAMQMAYRSAHAFKPNDAMLEISRAARDGHMKLELMLEPASLGKIQVSLQTDAAKQIQVHLMVDQAASRQVLEQQLPQLRQALADQGLNLSGFSMDMSSQQQQEQGHGSSSTFVADMRDGVGISTTTETSTQILGTNMAEHGRLNILA